MKDFKPLRGFALWQRDRQAENQIKSMNRHLQLQSHFCDWKCIKSYCQLQSEREYITDCFGIYLTHPYCIIFVFKLLYYFPRLLLGCNHFLNWIHDTVSTRHLVSHHPANQPNTPSTWQKIFHMMMINSKCILFVLFSKNFVVSIVRTRISN